MSLQGPMIVVAEQPAAELVEALRAAGAFPVVESKWTDAPTAFVAVKPSAVIIAEPDRPPSESSARMLCLQVATQSGPVAPILTRVDSGKDMPVPIALPCDISFSHERLIARLRSALRVRALHETVLRRIETFTFHGGAMPSLPLGDALEDATVLVAGRGPLYSSLGVAAGERFTMIGALSVESAIKHLNERDIDGLILGDGFSPRMFETLLTTLVQDARFRDMPVAVTGDVPADLADQLSNIVIADSIPAQIVERMMPLVRMHAFEARLKRMLKSLEADGMFDPETGLLTGACFLRDIEKAVANASERGHALSVARLTLDPAPDARSQRDAARQLARMTRNVDFACRDDEGTILLAMGQTSLREAHVVVRRIAGALKNAVTAMRGDNGMSVNVTLTSLKAGDNLDTLMQRLMTSNAAAA